MKNVQEESSKWIRNMCFARELKDEGTYASFLEGALSYPDANRLFRAEGD